MLSKTQEKIMELFTARITEKFSIKEISELSSKPYPLVRFMAKKSTSRAYLVPLALLLFVFAAYFASAAPSQTTTSWKDNFTDQAGISALSNINFSAGNISISNSPWFYPNHEYRKQITINGSTTNLSDYQIPINLTTAIYNNTGLVGSWHFTNNDTSDSSGYGNNGAQNGGVNCTVAGKFGTGCGFDGTAEF